MNYELTLIFGTLLFLVGILIWNQGLLLKALRSSRRQDREIIDHMLEANERMGLMLKADSATEAAALHASMRGKRVFTDGYRGDEEEADIEADREWSEQIDSMMRSPES